jgi:hypothetical protein
MAVQCQSPRIQCCTKREKSLGGCRGIERVNEGGTRFGEEKKMFMTGAAASMGSSKSIESQAHRHTTGPQA